MARTGLIGAVALTVAITFAIAGSDNDSTADDAGVTEPSSTADRNGSASDTPNVEPAVDGFAEDLAKSKATTKVSIGDPCEQADGSWTRGEAVEPPVLVPVEGTGPDGSCIVGGWSYTGSRDFPFELPEEDGYILQPIFDEQGAVIDYHGLDD